MATLIVLAVLFTVVNLLVALVVAGMLAVVVKVYTEILKMRALLHGDRWDGKKPSE